MTGEARTPQEGSALDMDISLAESTVALFEQLSDANAAQDVLRYRLARAFLDALARVEKAERALGEIADLDPNLTHDGIQRGWDSRYEDEVHEIALAALRTSEDEAWEKRSGQR